MKVLLIESAPGAAHPLAEQLVDEGHTVVSCNDEHGGPCRGVSDHVDCPLHDHIDLAVVARSTGQPPTLNEMGSVCAEQRRVPVVAVDPATAADELPSVEVAAAMATRRVEAGYVAAVRHELATVAPGLHPDVAVHRSPGRIHVALTVPAGSNASAIADRARYAVRTYDPFVAGIDVSVATDGGPRD